MIIWFSFILLIFDDFRCLGCVWYITRRFGLNFWITPQTVATVKRNSSITRGNKGILLLATAFSVYYVMFRLELWVNVFLHTLQENEGKYSTLWIPVDHQRIFHEISPRYREDVNELDLVFTGWIHWWKPQTSDRGPLQHCMLGTCCILHPCPERIASTIICVQMALKVF